MKSYENEVATKVNGIITSLERQGYRNSKTAWCGGYLRRRPESIIVYRRDDSRFSGVVVEVPSYESTRYHIRLYYDFPAWIISEAKEVAESIRACADYRIEDVYRLCTLAGLRRELDECKPEGFERILYKAARRLGVDIG